MKVENSAGTGQNAPKVLDNSPTACGSVSCHALTLAIKNQKVRLSLTKPDISPICFIC